jgi:hypothetical protein
VHRETGKAPPVSPPAEPILGFSVSSETIYPGIRSTGRLRNAIPQRTAAV